MEPHVGPQLMHSSLLHTAALLSKWEALNRAAVSALKRIMSPAVRRGHSSPLRTWKRARRSRAAVLRGLSGGGTLLDACIERFEESDRIAELGLPDAVLEGFQRRRHAAAVVERFLTGCAMARRAQISRTGTQLIVRSASSSSEAGESKTIWDPSKLPPRVFVALLRKHGKHNLELRRESRAYELLRAVYCLWLINPAVLLGLISVFLIADLGAPWAAAAARRAFGAVSRKGSAMLAKRRRHLETRRDNASEDHLERL